MRDGSRFTYDPTGTDPDPQPGPLPKRKWSPAWCFLGSLLMWAAAIGIVVAIVNAPQ
jgi:hypothetical protein